jgi:P22 coat protein - gene protein 5
MATGFNTKSQITVVELFAEKALPALKKTLLMGSLINRQWDNRPGDVGDTIHVPVSPTGVVANDISEGSNVQYQQTSVGNVDITVDKHKEASFTLTDVVQVMTNVDLIDTYVVPHIIAVAEQVEADIMGLYANLTTSAVGSQGTPLTSAVIGSAETALYNAKAYGEKYLVLSPTDYDVVRALPEFSNQYQIGNDQNALATGILGQIKGFNVFRSQLAPSVTVGSPAVTTRYNMAFTPDAMTLVSRPFKAIPQGLGAVSTDIDMGTFKMQLVWSYNPVALAQQFTVHVLYGVKALRPTFGLQVRA